MKENSSILRRQTPQFLQAHKRKHKAEYFANSSLVKPTLWFARELESVVSVDYDKSWALYYDCSSNEYHRWDGWQVLQERSDFSNSFHLCSQDDVRVGADDCLYHIWGKMSENGQTNWWAMKKLLFCEAAQTKGISSIQLITLSSFAPDNWLNSIDFDSFDGTFHSSWWDLEGKR